VFLLLVLIATVLVQFVTGLLQTSEFRMKWNQQVLARRRRTAKKWLAEGSRPIRVFFIPADLGMHE
jgi:hypothetical protein